MNIAEKYLLNVAIGLDQFLNTVWGGTPDETISSRIGRIKEANGNKIPWNRPVVKFIEAGLNKLQKDHCINAIERDEFEEIKEHSVVDGKVDTK